MVAEDELGHYWPIAFMVSTSGEAQQLEKFLREVERDGERTMEPNGNDRQMPGTKEGH